jgi:hypothetical protein
MIIRILGEGQYDVPDGAVSELNVLDERLETAIEAGDEATFSVTLSEMFDKVRSDGQPVALDALVTSDLVLPPADSSLAEVRELLSEEGLIPGRADTTAP